ncbi:ABC transporter ATP-binding protein [Sneathiella marina]|uniref:ABC transporter ATP-binding protein n=1 Tax=Sneathiella marina TaxID=2950108 RepID=A0ABY4W769_9PROT|nr:ABC transporter ATP-binding protein [Sneathiella marina]USG61600.1 ABC transporter ATP-binding protein [Sneathiella marina]
MMELRGLEKSYGGKPAIKDLSLDIHKNEYLTLLGPSGSGKSTLLRLIAGLEQPDRGGVFLDNAALLNMPAHMRNLGFVQQKYALFPHMAVFDNVAFGLRYRHLNPLDDEAEIRTKVMDMLELVGLSDLEMRKVGQLSGGQKQRVSVARTLVCEPKICLLDEPLGALDANLRERMAIELRRIRAALGVTFLHVTGNETEALAMGDRVVVLDNGCIRQVDIPEKIFTKPTSIQVAKFVNAYNLFPGKGRPEKFEYCDHKFPLRGDAGAARYYGIRYDQMRVSYQNDGQAGLSAKFVTSEFEGARIKYFFECPDVGVFEAEVHLGEEGLGRLQQGEEYYVSWDPNQALLFDGAGELMSGFGATEGLQ